ncbi:helix-turn-helix domain-containing protein [Xenorhabdus sp. TCT-1]|uniref:Helix-turn-helix domain-containing protein n=2 Tax=Xenorhabdus taiwanensis TaxID=3085177 RepID=A0ABN7C6C7_9GAMM|nr:helix-turn-helix domain-containing protein [Xenorhabdus sp. TCT-1]
MIMKMSNQIGARIKRLREQLGLSQAALAEHCGWSSQSRIGNYESGSRNVSADDAVILANALSVTPAELMFGSTDCANVPMSCTTEETKLTPRQRILLELFDELPDSEADQLLKNLEEKKQHYNQLLEELLHKRNQKKA